MLCSRLPAARQRGRKNFYNLLGALGTSILNAYERSLTFVLRHQFATLVVFLLTFATTLVLFIEIPKGFFPVQDNGLIVGLSEAAPDVSPAEMKRVQQEFAAILARDPDIASFGSVIGAGGAQTGNTGRFFIALKPRAERKSTATQIINRLRPQLAQVEGAALYLQPGQDITVGGRIARGQFQYTLQDASLNELTTWSSRVLEKLKTLPQLTDVSNDLVANAPQLAITIDRDQAARFGIQPQVIDDTLNDAFGQRQIVQYYTQVDAYNVVLEIPPAMQADLSSLSEIYVKSASGQAVPLSTLVKIDSSKVGALQVSHQQQFPAATLSFNLATGTSLGQAVDAIEQATREVGMPNTVIGTFQGNAQAFQTSLSSEPLLIFGALLVVYIILGVLYESYVHPLTILSTLPSAGVGALLALWVAGFDLSVIGIIGIILLIGIVKKNGIMLVDFAVTAEREHGMAPESAVRQACLLRFRPIMMTTMAAMLGGIPLMLGAGSGSELRQPLGYAIVGGLAFSQLMTLYTTPVIYLYLDRLQNWIGGTAKREAERAEASIGAAQ
jgi:multidrug efflux pump subunit AcrB